MSKKEDTVTTVTSLDSASETTAPTRNRSQRQPAAAAAATSSSSSSSNAQSHLDVPETERQDFPSPGSAPEGHNIFDANAVAEEHGVETVPGGWAEGVKEQEKLQEEYAAQDQGKKGLKDKVKDLLHMD